MRFLDPSFLWFLPLALLPLLLNLIFPLKPFKLPFSSVFLLAALRDSRLKKITAAKTLILLLRCLALLALVCAFSRPVADRGLLGALPGLTAGSGRPVSLVVLADRSLSMNARFAGRSRLDFAAATGIRVLAALGGRDEAALVFFDSEVSAGDWTRDLGAVSARLSAARPGYSGTDYRKALEKAYALLASRPASRKKAVLVLSDGARAGFASMPAKTGGLAGYDPAVTLTGLVFPAAPNAWLGAVSCAEKNGGDVLTAAAGGSGGLSAAGAAAGLYAPLFSGSRKAGPAGVSFPLPPGGSLSGRVELLAPDALEPDNAAYFSLARSGRGAARVLVLYPGPEDLKPGAGAYFLKKFFEAGSAAGGAFSADFTELAGLERAPGGEYGAVVVFDGSATARQAGFVRDYVRSGGGAFIAAGAALKPGAEPAVLSSLGFRAGEILSRDLFPDPRDASGGFAGADFSGFDLGRAVVSRAAVFETVPPGLETLWDLRDAYGARRPALLGGRSGGGRLLVWTSSFSQSDTDLAAKPVFAPFMHAALRRLCGVRPAELRQVHVGGVFEGALENKENAKVAVSAPGGSRSYVLARHGRFRYQLTETPGLYTWSAPPESGAFAVNLDAGAGENSLEPAGAVPWIRLPDSAPVEAFKSAVYGVEVGQFLVLLALLMFLAEFLLSRRVL